MSRIYWDSMLFAYWLEDNPAYSSRVQQIYETMRERRDSLCTSVFTVGEVLAGPYKKGAIEEAAPIRDFFRSPRVEILPFTIDTADRFARIRAEHRISPADAIHLATAAQTGVDLFLTNDHRLAGKIIPGIHFIARMDVNLF